MQKIKQDHIVGLLLLLLGIGAMVLSMQITVKTGSTDPGSRLFPMLASILLTVCGAGVLAIWKRIVYAVVVTAISWLVFQEMLSMALPGGVLF